MRAIAACHFELSRFGAWRLVVMALACCACLAVLFWFLRQPLSQQGGIAAAAGVAAAAALGLGASLGWVEAVSLRWDGRAWHVDPADSAGQEGTAGTLSVALDLGVWMLLRFQADASRRWSGVTWLPVQRRGLESQWHALRCAVYSPRPAGDADAAADL